MSDPDLFGNFERMRREMEELFGDVFDRAGLPRRRTGFTPRVDVAYSADPPRVIVTAEIAGVELEDLEIEVEGRTLALRGRRRSIHTEGDTYQQVEIERGDFRRVIDLGAEVGAEQARATYEDGMLRIELPLPQRTPAPSRRVRIKSESDQ